MAITPSSRADNALHPHSAWLERSTYELYIGAGDRQSARWRKAPLKLLNPEVA